MRVLGCRSWYVIRLLTHVHALSCLGLCMGLVGVHVRHSGAPPSTRQCHCPGNATANPHAAAKITSYRVAQPGREGITQPSLLRQVTFCISQSLHSRRVASRLSMCMPPGCRHARLHI